ncbi:MAG: hypothetical protein WAX04_10865 [Oscillospiraceae bacterium]
MKKVFSLLMCLFTVFCFNCNVVYAQDNVYNIDELKMSLKIPEELVVFTRNIDENDPNLGLFKTDKATLEELYKASDIYLTIFDKTNKYSIIISMYENDYSKSVYNFNELEDEELIKQAQELNDIDLMSKNGITFLDFITYNTNQAKFVKMNFEKIEKTQTMYGVQCQTIVNGQTINIGLSSYDNLKTVQKDEFLNKIIDSISFSEVLENPNPHKNNNSTYFYIKNISFVVVALVSFWFFYNYLIKKKKRNISAPNIL